MTDREARPEQFVVRIVGPHGVPVGVGTLVGPREILTCAHVVNAALGRPQRSQTLPDAPLTVDFPLLPDEPGRRARVERWTPPPDDRSPGDDIAGLVLVDDGPPAGALPARLAVNLPPTGRTLRVFGYPGRPPRPDGAWVPTALRGQVGGGRLQLDSGPDAALRVQPGYSGSPVYDETTGRVVGMLALAPAASTGDRDSYATAPDRLRLTWPGVLDLRSASYGTGRPGTGRDRAGADRLTVLHVSDPQFGRHHLFGGNGLTPADRPYDALHARLHQDLTGLADRHGLLPDLLVVTGDLAERGLRSEFEQVAACLEALCEAVELPRSRVVVVPGNHDVNRKGCESYFNAEEADEREPVPPYFPKWKQFVAAFKGFYVDVPGVSFTPDEPWTLFEVPDLRVVVAGLNSTMAESHLDTDHYGWLGERQLRWFADRLADYRARGWLRLAAVHHNAVRGAVQDDENLRDADDLDRILGEPGLVHLLLHGHTHDGRLHRLPSGLVALATGSAAVMPDARPAEVPNQYQLVTIERNGFTRYARQYAVGQRRWIGDTRISRTGSEWHDRQSYALTDVDATFPPEEPVDEPADPKLDHVRLGDVMVSTTVQGYEPGRPDDTLFGRVVEATRFRYPLARLDLRPGKRYLRVSNPLPDGDGAGQWAVGVLDAAPTAEAVRQFAGSVHAGFASADPRVRSELVHPGPAASKELVDEARRQGVRLLSFVAYQGLLDLSPLLGRQSDRLANDRIYPPGMYLPQRYRMVDAYAEGDVREGLDGQVCDWLRDDAARLVMVLGDFGRGKTALLRHLAHTLPDVLPDLEPVLVELRSLEKAPSLDELLGQHLIRNQVEDINPAKLRYMIHSGRLALLFDGFDELELRVGYDSAADYLRILLESVTDRAKVVLTSRTQHFRSTRQVRTALGDRIAGLTASRVVVLEDFTTEQIIRFLTNLYGGDGAAAQARYRLITEIEDLLGLARNPRMLAFIAKLDEQRLRDVQQRKGRISAAELYHELVDFWLVGEATRQQHRHGKPSLDEKERLDACTALARRLWASTEPTIALATLSAEVGATLTRLAERGYNADQAAHSVASGSLLVRADDDAFTFVHQSIMEWLVANAAADDLRAGGDSEELRARRLSPLMVDFFGDLAGHTEAARWADRVLADPDTGEVAKQNALAVRTRVGAFVPPGKPVIGERHSLAGLDLRTQDLSGRDLRGADLREADLRRVRLEGVDLSGADLRHADFTGTRLVGGSLRDARLGGSRWFRAALLGTELDVPAPELAAAAVVGQDRATVAVTPPGAALSVAFAPDGALLAMARGHFVEVIDRADNRTIGLLAGHSGPVTSVDWSPDGTRLATASDDGTARIWDTATGQATVTLTGHTARINAVGWSADNAHVATASADDTARIWDATTGQTTTILTGHTDWVRAIAWSPDGTLATASDDKAIRIWDTTTGQTTTILTGHTDWVRAIAWSPDGTLATASDDRTIRIWDTTTGQTTTTLTGHTLWITAIAWSPDGTRLATASDDNTIRIWDTTTGQTTTTLTGQGGRIHAVAWSPDGAQLATSSISGGRIWDTVAGQPLTTLTGETAWVRGVAWSPDGTRIATASDDNTIRTWHLATGRSSTVLTGHHGQVAAVVWSADGTQLATAYDDNTIRVWHLATGRLTGTVAGDNRRVAAVAWSPDGIRIATVHDDAIRIWDTSTGQTTSTLTDHTDGVRALAWAPDGTRLATSSNDATIRIWQTRTGESTTLARHNSLVNEIAWSPDGVHLATSSADGTTRIWDTTTDESTILAGHSRSVSELVWSPDGVHLAISSADGTIRIWDTTAGRPTTTLTGHAGGITAIAWSPDGTHLATSSADGTTRIWDATTAEPLAILVGLPDEGYAVLFPDGSYKLHGDPGDVLWWSIKLCRFAPGELDPYVPEIRRLPDDHPLLSR
ncbi:WD40 domain-containing protein [Plantactinospora sonchi]|uniref:Pentapeptide repeat-containing protein n=1 Tax=Plantactinospora sonchi TaxID=1544735 RepID=A0ABU7RZG1_9ACTN